MRRASTATLYCSCVIALLLHTARADAARPAAASANAITEPAVVDQPRAFGYFLGDVFTQRVLLRAASADFTPAELPAPRRLNIWFERRAARIEASDDGSRWLSVDYQVINTPQALETVTLPDWTLESDAGTKLTVPAWPISITALTPTTSGASPTVGELRPDRGSLRLDAGPIRRQLFLWSTALLIALGAWFAWVWRRNDRDRLEQPFARALQEIEQMQDTAPEAWRALHRAFDRTAGRSVQIDTLPLLFTTAPHLEPLRSRIHEFFDQSSARFFGGAEPEHPLSVSTLCRDLRRIEKRCAS